MILVLGTGIAAWAVRPWDRVFGYFVVLLIQYLLVRNSAANAGRRFVNNVLAIASQTQPPNAEAPSKRTKR